MDGMRICGRIVDGNVSDALRFTLRFVIIAFFGIMALLNGINGREVSDKLLLS